MTEPPSGAVTFLFTDIEGSTQLVRRLRDRYGGVLAEHQRLLRAAFAGHGGYEVDTQGDAFFFAFASARDAVLAAIEAQRALAGYPWPDETPVKVRMGIHTGQAVPVDGRYTGLAVHRAARISAAGHGGQVLVSQTTQSLLEDEEEDLAVALRDLGEQRLKDIDRPVRVYQVAATGLTAEFPPLRREEEPSAVAPPTRRVSNRLLALLGTVAAVAIAAVVALLATRGDGGLSGVRVNHVGVIDSASGRVVDEIEVGLRPGPIALSGETLWVGNEDEKTLTRIATGTREIESRVTLERRTPTGIAASPGAVWLAHGALPGGLLVRVDPEFNQVVDPTLDAPAQAVALGDGAVWTVKDSTVARIDPTRGAVVGTDLAGTGPHGIAFADGVLWVTNGGGVTVHRFNPATFGSGWVDEIDVGRHPVAVAVGGGSVWVACAGDDRVYRIDPATGGLMDTIKVGKRPTAIAVGEGAVWVANSGDGTISKIDPTESEVVDTITVRSYPAGVAVGAGFVWVTVQEQ